MMPPEVWALGWGEAERSTQVSLRVPGKRSEGLFSSLASPRKLQCPGCSLENVCMLLTPEDANRILALALGKTVVIVGASFIGMEVAASLLGKAAQLQVVEREELPYLLTLGGQVGTVAMQMLEAQGVRFHMKTEVAQMQGEDGKVTSVLLSNGSVLPADLVVVGIGE
uniref:L-amino-acid oxidase n=1 Tax=Naja naja TaxID=35670 RepID=A0A8C6V8I0_NAJNA